MIWQVHGEPPFIFPNALDHEPLSIAPFISNELRVRFMESPFHFSECIGTMNRFRSLRSFPMSCVYGSWKEPPFVFSHALGP